MDKVQGMVQQVAETARGERHPGQLAVHGIEKGHEPSQRQAGNEMAVPESRACQDRQHHAEPGNVIRPDAKPGADFCRPPRRDRPHPLGDQVGHALIGTAEQLLLKFIPVIGAYLPGPGRLVFFQPVVIGVDQVVGFQPARHSGFLPGFEYPGFVHCGAQRDQRAAVTLV